MVTGLMIKVVALHNYMSKTVMIEWAHTIKEHKCAPTSKEHERNCPGMEKL